MWAEDLPPSGAASLSDGPGVTAIVFDKGPQPFDGSPTQLVDCAKDLDDYVALPGQLGRRYHAVLVNGRKRRRCLSEAADLLEENGVALLHDAQRPYYHEAFTAFRSGRRVGDELWIGAQAATDFADVVSPKGLAALGIDYVPGA